MHLIKFKFRKIDNVPLIMQIPRICQNKVKRNTVYQSPMVTGVFYPLAKNLIYGPMKFSSRRLNSDVCSKGTLSLKINQRARAYCEMFWLRVDLINKRNNKCEKVSVNLKVFQLLHTSCFCNFKSWKSLTALGWIGHQFMRLNVTWGFFTLIKVHVLGRSWAAKLPWTRMCPW